MNSGTLTGQTNVPLSCLRPEPSGEPLCVDAAEGLLSCGTGLLLAAAAVASGADEALPASALEGWEASAAGPAGWPAAFPLMVRWRVTVSAAATAAAAAASLTDDVALQNFQARHKGHQLC